MSKNGLILLTPTSVNHTGTSASISANGSVSFSGCSLLSLNGVFSADYDNYMVVISQACSGGQSDIFMGRLRSSGSDNSSNYTNQELAVYGGSVVGNRYSQSSFRIGATVSASGGNTGASGVVVYFYGPFLAQKTAYRSIDGNGYVGASIYDEAGTHSVSSSFDGITIFATTTPTITISGRVAVYGMRK